MEKLNQLSIEGLFKILRILVQNKAEPVAITDICFKIFHQILPFPFGDVNWIEDVDYGHFQQLFLCIGKCVSRNLFSIEVFSEKIYEYTDQIPLQILWWLDKSNLILLGEYYVTKQPNNIPLQLIVLLNTDTLYDEELYSAKNIACDFVADLIKSCFCAKSRITASADYLIYDFSKTLEYFVEHILKKFQHEPETCKAINIIPLIEKKTDFSETLVKDFFEYIIKKLIFYNADIDFYGAYKMHEEWTTEKLPICLVHIFQRLAIKCNLNELLNLVMTSEGKVNWKNLLITISCVSKISNKENKLKDWVTFNLHNAFEVEDSKKLIRIILMARQACLENGKIFKSYSTWYSNMFGVDSNFKTGSDRNKFSLLLITLSQMIPYEPDYSLAVHIDRSLRVPPTCMTQMLDFKSICKTEQFGRK